MEGKNNTENNSNQKKARKLFWGMLAPLLIVTITACTFFYYVSNQILKAYMESQLELSVEKLNSTVSDSMQPIILNVDNFVTFSADYSDDEILELLLNAFSGKLDEYASMLYYAPVKKLSEGGRFLNNQNWLPPAGFEPSERVWYQEAVKNQGKTTFSTPYVDANTGELCVAISQAVYNSQGKLNGVIGCDILLNHLMHAINEIQISKNAKLDLITDDGFFLTNEDSSKVMTTNWKDVTTYKGNISEWLNGETKTYLDRKNYYAVCKIGNAPWFIVVEGPVMDFQGILSNVIIVFEIILILFSIVMSVLNINTIRKMRQDEQKLAEQLFEDAQSLVVSSKENAATAQDQSAAVKEIVATMEDNTALSEDISQRIQDVSGVAVKTNTIVAEGVSFIEANMKQLQEIAATNMNTIEGIKALGEKIENIWGIVSLINSVADQAKIIAFNAELEANNTNSSGKNFHIVANEIRRLADGIIESTKEIKSKITEIQESSDDLILTSENGTEKIQSGVENAKNLETRFESIKNASEITAESAEKITTIIQQQTSASEQILITLKQISAGVSNFSMATEYISKASENLKLVATELSANTKSSDSSDEEEADTSEETE
ncbi:MAG: hypothetical protein J6X78_09100, partial [Treponema sp.]|nr:hypothetical protein [Treponema sp.]